MNDLYPTYDQVDHASNEQLSNWLWDLPDPGSSAFYEGALYFEFDIYLGVRALEKGIRSAIIRRIFGAAQ